jgi:hypothetical protein
MNLLCRDQNCPVFDACSPGSVALKPAKRTHGELLRFASNVAQLITTYCRPHFGELT